MNRLEESRREDSDEDDVNLGIIAAEKQAFEKRIKETIAFLIIMRLLKRKGLYLNGKVELGSLLR